MSKICTSLEQSQKLIELGIDVNTADMDYIQFANNPKEYDCIVNLWNNEHEEDWIPAWSLSALFKMLPYSARLERGHCTELSRITLLNELESSKWHIDPIDAAFEIVCWLLKNKKL